MNAYVSFKAAGGKDSINQFWPMGEPEKEKPQMTKEMYDTIMNRYKIKR